jgi:Protein of unknown function (DUF2568)
MATANLVLRFVVELVGIGALAYWGFNATGDGIGRIALMIGAPLVLIVIWATVVAPKTANGLSQPQKDVIGTVLLLVAAGALAAVGQPAAAVAFGAVVLVNWGLLVVFGERPVGLAAR